MPAPDATAQPENHARRVILFRRRFHALNGAALKAWDYINHTDHHPAYRPLIHFTSVKSQGENPYLTRPDLITTGWEEIRPAAFFVATYEWEGILSHPAANQNTPIIHPVQSLLHADPTDPRYRHIGVKAIRIAVSPEVAAALEADPAIRGPVITIPNGIPLPDLTPARREPTCDVFIAGLKRPVLAEYLRAELEARGFRVVVLTRRIPHARFLRHLRSCRVAVTLPYTLEGFFLPALEAMAIGALVVCPDCVGNRSFCIDGVNAFRPAPNDDEILAAVLAALALPPDQAKTMRDAARSTASDYSLSRERKAFHRILDDLDLLWKYA